MLQTQRGCAALNRVGEHHRRIGTPVRGAQRVSAHDADR